ncbi:hypothetical protein BsWGS_12587 [Bradybaena similaris]
MKLLPVLFACTLFLYSSYGGPEIRDRTAICNMEPNSAESDQPVRGIVVFRQLSYESNMTIDVQLSGFKHLPRTAYDTEYLHGFHVHEFGNLTGGCDATGGHYNPFEQDHGGLGDVNRHVGDFGNLRQTPDGNVDVQFIDTVASVWGEFSNIIGRGLVVHANVDDLGKGNNISSKINGNSGKRLACCVIGFAAHDRHAHDTR